MTDNQDKSVRSSSYRPDIDGLRAFSILAVIAYHTFPQVITGGMVGVDVFFVISGFLITGIILAGLRTDTFSYSDFYLRRIKRIFPSLLIVLVTCLALGWVLLFQDEWTALGKHVISGGVFVSNLALLREGRPYFGPSSAQKPLLHLWSLGIEEQFYIVWPVFLALTRRRPRATIIAIISIVAASFALNVWFVGSRPAVAFYSPPTRFWELLTGSILAWFSSPVASGSDQTGGPSTFLPNRLATKLNPGILSLLGFTLLATSLFLIDERSLFPGFWAILPIGGAALVLVAGPQAFINRWVFSNRLMVFVGLISYPLYLWHWPALVFMKLFQHDNITLSGKFVAVSTAVALACGTYTLIEGRLRHNPAPKVPLLLCTGLALITITGVSVRQGWLKARHDGPVSASIAAASADWNYPFSNNFGPQKRCPSGQLNGTSQSKVLFVGDSHLEQYYPRVEALVRSHPENFPTSYFMTCSGCPPLPDVNILVPGYDCANFFESAMTRAKELNPDIVVFGAFWESYFGFEVEGDSMDGFGGQAKLFRPSLGNRAALVAGRRTTDDMFAEFGASIGGLTAKGTKVFIILSNPTGKAYSPRSSVNRLTGKRQISDVNRAAFVRAVSPILAVIRRVAINAGAQVLDPVETFCEKDVCRTAFNNQSPVYRDDEHLGANFAATAATFIDQIYEPGTKTLNQ